MNRFYLTTAIDYVNSRPHLGHGLREDHRRRHRPLQAAVRRRDAFPHGQRRALAERVPQGARARRSIRSRTAIGWSRSSATSGSGSTSRSTTSSGRPSRGTRPACRSWCRRMPRRRRHLRRALRRLVLRLCEAFKQEKDLVDGKCPLHRTKPEWIREKNYFFRLSAYPRPAARRTFAAHPEFIAAGRPPQRDPAPARGRARGHLDQPRRAVVGHPAAVRSGERRLRLVRRADQLRGGGRLRHRRRAVRRSGGRPTCTSSARTSRGSTRDLAGDADERRRCRCRGRCSATAG